MFIVYETCKKSEDSKENYQHFIVLFRFIFQGTTVGSIAGFAFALWVGIGSYSIKRHLDVLPTSTVNCTRSDDVTTDLTTLILTTMTSTPTTPINEAIVET